jgi:hypothetical protein
VRFLLALLLVAAVAFVGLFAETSCVIDYRDLDGSTDGSPEGGQSVLGEGGFEADAPETDLDFGCCSRVIVPTLPTCTGMTAIEVPAKDCSAFACNGQVAYVLCQDDCYSACACDLPAGFTLVDGGGPLPPGDGGSADGDADASETEAGPETGAGVRDAPSGS